MGKRGPAPGSARKGAPTAIRFDPALKRRVAAAAAEAGRSFSEEVEARLALSFDAPEFNSALETKALAVLLFYALEIVELQAGAAWFRDRWTFDQASDAVMALLSFFQPMGPPTVPNDALVLKSLRAQGLDNMIEQARAELQQSNLGKKAGMTVVAAAEIAADAGPDVPLPPPLRIFRPIAEIVKARLLANDADGTAHAELFADFKRTQQ